jgi:hypothetical protein
MRFELTIAIIIATAVLAPSGAAAQVEMRCRPGLGGREICEETTTSRWRREDAQRQAASRAAEDERSSARSSAASSSNVYSWRDVKPTPCSKLEAVGTMGSNYCEARGQAAGRKAIGELIAQGKCEDALKQALATGDLDFAREVRDFCRVSAPAS